MSRKIVFLSIFLSSFFLPGDAMASFINRINLPNIMVGLRSLMPFTKPISCSYVPLQDPSTKVKEQNFESLTTLEKQLSSLETERETFSFFQETPEWAKRDMFGATAFMLIRSFANSIMPITRSQFDIHIGKLIDFDKSLFKCYMNQTKTAESIGEEVLSSRSKVEVLEGKLQKIENDFQVRCSSLDAIHKQLENKQAKVGFYSTVACTRIIFDQRRDEEKLKDIEVRIKKIEDTRSESLLKLQKDKECLKKDISEIKSMLACLVQKKKEKHNQGRNASGRLVASWKKAAESYNKVTI